MVSCGQAAQQNTNTTVAPVINTPTVNANTETTSSGAIVAPDLEAQLNSRTVEVEQPSTPLSK